MDDAKGSTGTVDKSPDTTETFQTRFNAALEQWRKDGCPRIAPGESETALDAKLCGARPHRTKMSPKDDAGNHVMTVDCTNGHEAAWTFTLTGEELAASVAAQLKASREAEANGGKDPLKASVTIKLNLKTQEVEIDAFVPTPGVGLQLAAMLNCYFAAQFSRTLAQTPQPMILTPDKKIINPKTGKPIIQ